MARDLLSNLDDWDLVYDEQDVRGRDAYGTDGVRVGEIKDMLADTEAGRVVALVLDDGRQVDADLVEIGDDRVVIHSTQTMSEARTTGTPRVYGDYSGQHLRPRVATSDTYAAGTVSGAGTGAAGAISGSEASFGTPTSDPDLLAARDAGLGTHHTVSGTDAGTGGPHGVSGTDAGAYAGMSGLMGSTSNPVGSASFDDFADDDRYFRDYHRATYGQEDYDTYAPAYRSGLQYGRRSDWRDRDWGGLEPDMRRDYDAQHGEGTWERFKDHVRSGFDRARNAVTGGDDDNRRTPY